MTNPLSDHAQIAVGISTEVANLISLAMPGIQNNLAAGLHTQQVLTCTMNFRLGNPGEAPVMAEISMGVAAGETLKLRLAPSPMTGQLAIMPAGGGPAGYNGAEAPVAPAPAPQFPSAQAQVYQQPAFPERRALPPPPQDGMIQPPQSLVSGPIPQATLPEPVQPGLDPQTQALLASMTPQQQQAYMQGLGLQAQTPAPQPPRLQRPVIAQRPRMPGDENIT